MSVSRPVVLRVSAVLSEFSQQRRQQLSFQVGFVPVVPAMGSAA